MGSRRAVGVGISVRARARRHARECDVFPGGFARLDRFDDRLIPRRFDSIRFKSRARYFFFWIDFDVSIDRCEREVAAL